MSVFKLINKITKKEYEKFHRESFASFYAHIVNSAGYGKEEILDQVKRYGIEVFRIVDMDTGEIMFDGKKEPAKGGFIKDESSIPFLNEINNYGNLNEKKETEKLFKETKEIKVRDLVEKPKVKRKYRKRNATRNS
jgi:hypothetical protein